VDAETLIAATAIVFLAAASYSVTGFGFALVATPLLTLVWDAKSAVVASVLLSTTALLPLLFEVRGHVNPRRISVLVAGSFVGIPVGIFLLERLDSDALSVLIATTVIVATVALYLLPHGLGERDTVVGRFGAGLLGGTLGASTSMGGPPVVLYELGREHEIDTFRASLMAYFLPGNLVTIAGFIIVGRLSTDVLVFFVVALPAVLLGLVAGSLARRHIDPARFRLLVMALLIGSSISVIGATLAGA
jgi:uncharacterized membrane protein YfcA